MSWYLDNNNKLLYSHREVYQGGRYIKADWIEFNWETHTGYIDVGYPRTNNRTLIVDFECVDSINAEEWICGAAVDVNTNHGNGAIVGTSTGTYWYTGLGASYNPQNMAVNTKTRGTITNGYNNSSNNNVYIGCRNWAYEGETSRPNNNIPSDFKVYYFYLADGNTVLRDMYPVYDTVNQEWGMYDTVSQSFFGNAGGIGTSIKGGYYNDAYDLTPQPLAFDYNDPPASMWYINNEGLIVSGLLPQVMDNDLGALSNNPNLSKVTIPQSCKSIGRFSFAKTALSVVKIANDCKYYDSSFPEHCTVTFYPSNNT